MVINNIDSATTTDMTNSVTDFSTNSSEDRATDEYITNWSRWQGYYRQIWPLQSLIDKKALWTIGKGYKADDKTTKQLKAIKGNGKDTFNTILSNGVRVYTIGGDFYAEIIKNARGVLRNLKPLNPSTIKVFADDFGMIQKYEQHVNGKLVHTFQPGDLFHLSWNRLADQNHGIGTIEKLTKYANNQNTSNVAEMYVEAMRDLRIVFHRYVKPLLVSHVDTDDATEIAAYKTKLDNAVENGENMVVPKDVVDKMERISIPQFSTLDPLPWINSLESIFLKAEGVPDVVLGTAGGATEASAKILYLAWQQVVEWNQLFIEEQCEAQLNIKLNLEFPASLEPEVKEQQGKDRKLNNMESGIGQNESR